MPMPQIAINIVNIMSMDIHIQRKMSARTGDAFNVQILRMNIAV